MIKITKPLLQKALIAGFFSTFTIGVLTVLTYKSTLGYFLAGSFGSSMVLLFGFPESPFAQPKNVFFGHLLTAFVGVVFVNYIPLPIYINIALAVRTVNTPIVNAEKKPAINAFSNIGFVILII